MYFKTPFDKCKIIILFDSIQFAHLILILLVGLFAGQITHGCRFETLECITLATLHR